MIITAMLGSIPSPSPPKTSPRSGWHTRKPTGAHNTSAAPHAPNSAAGSDSTPTGTGTTPSSPHKQILRPQTRATSSIKMSGALAGLIFIISRESTLRIMCIWLRFMVHKMRFMSWLFRRLCGLLIKREEKKTSVALLTIWATVLAGAARRVLI